MTLTEVKAEYYHYFLDEDYEMHGLYQSWYRSDSKRGQLQYNHGRWHGEYKIFNEDGSLYTHKWFEHDNQILDFLKGDKYPTDEGELLIHKLTYQGEFLPKMKLTEVKDEYANYFLDEDDEIHGLYQSWYSSGSKRGQIQTNHGRWHGEYKIFHEDGSLFAHRWYENNEPIIDFLNDDKYPTDEDERLIFKLTYQGEFLPK